MSRGTGRGMSCGRRWSALLAAALVAALAAGCASIPDRGPIFSGPELDPAQQPITLVFARDPVPGSSPEEIVRGFLRAAPDFREDHQVARRFLTPAATTAWNDTRGTLVYSYEAALTIKEVDPAGDAVPPLTTGATPGAVVPRDGERRTVRVQVPVHARVDAEGRYTGRAAKPRTVTRTFILEARNGAWRIADLADGLLVAQTDFETTFRDVTLYFPDLSGTWLVPDVRWFPVSGTTTTPTLVVKALLGGPAPWLLPAVRKPMPVGTELAFQNVRVADGVATIDLNRRALDAEPARWELFATQTRATLQSLSPLLTVSAVTFTVEQKPFDPPTPSSAPSEPGGGDEPQPRVPPPVPARPIVLNGKGSISTVVAGLRLQEVSGLAALRGKDPQAPAVDADGSTFAVLLEGRSRMLVASPSGPAVELLAGRALTRPSFDPLGWVWSSPGANTGVVYAGRPEPGVRRVVAGWLRGQQVLAMRASTDGTRMLVLARAGDRVRAYASAVVRTTNGTPRELAKPIDLLPDLVSATDAVWLDGQHVVILGRRFEVKAATLVVVQIGGTARSDITRSDAVLVAAAGLDTLRTFVQTRTGAVLARSGSGWAPVKDAQWPAMPG